MFGSRGEVPVGILSFIFYVCDYAAFTDSEMIAWLIRSPWPETPTLRLIHRDDSVMMHRGW